ncbi:MAG: hypothetical protein M1834_000551 [Cirrosporium novae-zelandiae]|nr:MAG: hypothetical protein M1834_000551 [Cirrosporium novae-zelandiae]
MISPNIDKDAQQAYNDLLLRVISWTGLFCEREEYMGQIQETLESAIADLRNESAFTSSYYPIHAILASYYIVRGEHEQGKQAGGLTFEKRMEYLRTARLLQHRCWRCQLGALKVLPPNILSRWEDMGKTKDSVLEKAVGKFGIVPWIIRAMIGLPNGRMRVWMITVVPGL